jgi:hypothetical protein
MEMMSSHSQPEQSSKAPISQDVHLVTPVARYRLEFPTKRCKSSFTNVYQFAACFNA